MPDKVLKSDIKQSNRHLIEVENLTVSVLLNGDYLNVVRNVDFVLPHKTSIGILGESGCGKSITGSFLLKILPKPTFRVDSGNFFFEQEPIHLMDHHHFNENFRCKKIGMIFQEASSALNPVLKIGDQLQETAKKAGADNKLAFSLLEECGLKDPLRIMRSYPHQLSGGMKQRVLIALSLIGNPKVLVADEPTTAIDATIQEQILELLLKLQKTRGLSIVLISHDFKLIRRMCHYVYVLYCGNVVEHQKTEDLFSKPYHPYTKGLIDSSIGIKTKPKSKLKVIEGNVPDIKNWHKGCAFFDRCEFRLAKCKNTQPQITTKNNASFACFAPIR